MRIDDLQFEQHLPGSRAAIAPEDDHRQRREQPLHEQIEHQGFALGGEPHVLHAVDRERNQSDKDDKDQELKVTYEKGELSVFARKQPLVVVLYAIANELEVPLQVTDEIVDPISINIQKASVESALQQLSRNIRLYLRADLMTQERRPLRIVLVGQDKKS